MITVKISATVDLYADTAIPKNQKDGIESVTQGCSLATIAETRLQQPN